MGNFLYTSQDIINDLHNGKKVKWDLITTEFLTDNLKFLTENCFENLSHHFIYYEISEKFLESNITCPWNWKLLSETKTFVTSYGSIYSRNCVSNSFIEKHSELDWDWGKICKREKIDEKFLLKFTDKPLDWEYLSVKFSFGKLSQQFVINNIQKPWDWKRLSEYFPFNFIETHLNDPNFKWDWRGISENTNLTIEFIETYMDKLHPTDNIRKIVEKAREKR